jgi:hypothetical protein
MPKRIKHNDLTHYFLRDHQDLPPAYLASCRKFFNSFDSHFKPQASIKAHDQQPLTTKEYNKIKAASNKPQAASIKRQALDKSK